MHTVLSYSSHTNHHSVFVSGVKVRVSDFSTSAQRQLSARSADAKSLSVGTSFTRTEILQPTTSQAFCSCSSEPWQTTNQNRGGTDGNEPEKRALQHGSPLTTTADFSSDDDSDSSSAAVEETKVQEVVEEISEEDEDDSDEEEESGEEDNTTAPATDGDVSRDNGILQPTANITASLLPDFEHADESRFLAYYKSTVEKEFFDDLQKLRSRKTGNESEYLRTMTELFDVSSLIYTPEDQAVISEGQRQKAEDENKNIVDAT
ncbi:uncharacterized protein V1518DRAFT_402852 [Limtongia smithiae]|uniref:uncharacterized protein n=1 Tax=Limtongia smithiae TaxID=1125753 RepID=UPI0034CF65F7